MAFGGRFLRLAVAALAVAAGCSEAASSPEPAGPTCPALFYVEQDACVPLVIGDGSVAPSDASVDGFASVDVGPRNAEAGEGAPLDASAETTAGCAFTLTASPVHPPTVGSFSWVVVADLDLDGIQDMAVTATSADEMTVFSGRGNGTFSQGATYPDGMLPGAIAVGDLDRDGVPDLVVANSATNDSGTGGTADIYLGSRDGGPMRQSECQSGLVPTDLAIADVNLDARLDVVFSTEAGTSVLLGNGDGTLQAPLFYGSGFESAVVIGDANGDGKPDVVTSQMGPYAVVVQLGNGDGTFAPPIAHVLQGPLLREVVSIADVDHDGKMDVIAWNDTQLLVLLGHGDGTLADPAIYALGNTVSDVAVGDMNDDGALDVVATDNAGINVLFGRSDGTFGAAKTFGGVTSPFGVAIGDFNSDGKKDVVVAEGTNAMTVLLGSCMR